MQQQIINTPTRFPGHAGTPSITHTKEQEEKAWFPSALMCVKTLAVDRETKMCEGC